MSYRLNVAVLTPAHSNLAPQPQNIHLSGLLSYSASQDLAPGSLVRVPLGSRETLGIVWTSDAPEIPDTDPPGNEHGIQLRAIAGLMDTGAPLSPNWLQLINFAAAYYQRTVGEVALHALPPALRGLDLAQWARRNKRKSTPALIDAMAPVQAPALSPEQEQALDKVLHSQGPFLLFGATGSGKTEVFLQAVQQVLDGDPLAQVLVMVPEINLTPQLEARFVHRFVPQFGAQAVVSMHSGLTPAQRLSSWLAAHKGPANGGARIVLGTRMAIFASLPGLRLIVVDEEHDPSYKSQDGSRFSARDLAVYRARLDGAKVILGSATPSLESWRHGLSAPEGSGRYQPLHMPSRVGYGTLPQVRLVDMTQQPARTVFAPRLLEAMSQRIERGEQCLVLLNRRGYAPVLSCSACGWKSSCLNCSAHRVFHKVDRTLRCHHCGLTDGVPRACPECGNLDITPMGRGTEQIEEQLTSLLNAFSRPDGTPVRVARIDADSTRQKGELARQLADVHAGDVDVLVGTQMIAKGHDFRRVTLVAAINPDGALFSADFRAPERMFALLMQSAGRAGRDKDKSSVSEMWVQTSFPTHPLFACLKRHDFAAFAALELIDRAQAGMPPFSFQALIRADARTQEIAQGYLTAAKDACQAVNGAELVTLYPAVPLTVQRVANVERAQMLVECQSRPALQAFLAAWRPVLHEIRSQQAFKGLIRWAIDVDPQLI